MEEELREARQEILTLKDEVKRLLRKVGELSGIKLSTQIPVENTNVRPVIECPKINGGFRKDELTVDTCVCFYEATGKDTGLIVHDGLVRNQNKAEWLSYCDEEFDFEEAEKKIASARSTLLILSKDSLLLQSAVFIIQTCVTYNIPIISVHDLASCAFPNPAYQPIQVQMSGLFHDKAITYVKDYFDAVLGIIFKQISSSTQKRNFCICYSNSTPESEITKITKQMQTTKYCKLIIQSNDVPPHHYANHISHTIRNSNALIYIIDNVSESSNYLIKTAELCILHNTRMYFYGDDSTSVLPYLRSLPVHRLSGLSCESDGSKIQITSKISVESSAKFSDMLLKIPLHSGKHYYEVTMVTGGGAQLGWANSKMDISLEGSGLGDDTHSFAYDGSRETLLPRKQYGKQWKKGDVIGCMLDLDNQEIAYLQNGEMFGVAFKNFREKGDDGSLLPYYPGISTARGEHVSVNIGKSPFQYCPSGYIGVYESTPVTFVSPENLRDQVLNMEINYDNYNFRVPRTRAFLSHKRSSAQGIAGRIWQELKNDYHIFLDSEAQFDLHDLKEIAKNTGLFIFILSEGIFDSYWCLEELRSAIKNKRKVLVLQEYQFQFPDPFPQDLIDIRNFLASSDRLLYMAEFFSECIKQIRVRLGPTDKDLEAYLEYLTPTTKQCVLENSFGINVACFEFQGEIPMSITDYIKFLFNYFECMSFKEIDNFKQRGAIKFAISDSDVEYLTNYATKVRSITFESSEAISDSSIVWFSDRCKDLQIIKMPGLGGRFTDESCFALAKLKKLTSVMFVSAEKITDAGIVELSKCQLEWLTLDNDNITDYGISKLPPTLLNFESHSKNYSPQGIINMLKNVKLATLALPKAKLNDDCVIEVMKDCPFISYLDVRSSDLTDKCLNSVPIPASLKKIVVGKDVKLTAPNGSSIEIVHE